MKAGRIFYLGLSAFVLLVLIVTGLLFNSGTGRNETDRTAGPAIDIATAYAGENIRFLVPTEPGGGFDEYSRLLAPYLERYTGARVIIENMPGAGGMRAVNELATSPRDGLTIGIMNGSGMVTNRLAGIKGAEYSIEEFEYLGRVTSDTRVLSVTANSGIKSMADMLNTNKNVKIGATGLGGSNYVDAVITREAFGLNIQVIHGFDTFPGIRQAMIRGSLDGTWGPSANFEDEVESGAEIAILQGGMGRTEPFPDVPAVFEFIDDSEDPERTREILMAWQALNSIGRPVATTPGTPADRIQYLRNAFKKAMHDPEFLQKAEKAERPVAYASGEEMIRIIGQATDMKDNIEQLFIRLVRGNIDL